MPIRQLETTLRPRKAGFILTPLIDITFLLLVFFMLSSQLASFGLLPVSAVRGGASGVASSEATPPLVVRVTHGRVFAGDRMIELSDMADAAVELRRSGVLSVLVITTRSATVQDVVSTLEAFKRAGLERVTLLNRPGGTTNGSSGESGK